MSEKLTFTAFRHFPLQQGGRQRLGPFLVRVYDQCETCVEQEQEHFSRS